MKIGKSIVGKRLSVFKSLMFVAAFSGFASQAANAQDDDPFTWCYNLNWSEPRKLDQEPPATVYKPEALSSWTMYCQAAPADNPQFIYRTFHSYNRNRYDAETFAVIRCERHFDRCVVRCAAAPQSCSPHFWP